MTKLFLLKPTLFQGHKYLLSQDFVWEQSKQTVVLERFYKAIHNNWYGLGFNIACVCKLLRRGRVGIALFLYWILKKYIFGHPTELSWKRDEFAFRFNMQYIRQILHVGNFLRRKETWLGKLPDVNNCIIFKRTLEHVRYITVT